MNQVNIVDKKVEYLRRFINGDSYANIAREEGMAFNQVRHLANDLQFHLWLWIEREGILHPYTENAYPRVWSGAYGKKRFHPNLVNTWEVRREPEFWNDALDKYKAEHGSMDRPLTVQDKIERLALPYRAMNALRAQRITTIDELLRLINSPNGDLRKIPNIGPGSESVIAKELERVGFIVNITRRLSAVEMLERSMIMLRASGVYTQVQREALAQQIENYLNKR